MLAQEESGHPEYMKYWTRLTLEAEESGKEGDDAVGEKEKKKKSEVEEDVEDNASQDQEEASTTTPDATVEQGILHIILALELADDKAITFPSRSFPPSQ